MGWFQRLRGAVLPRDEPKETPKAEIAVGAKDDGRSTMTYNDKSITFNGDLASYDYDNILRDKQRNINSLYELSDYFVDADPIFRGIIKCVPTPFALPADWR